MITFSIVYNVLVFSTVSTKVTTIRYKKQILLVLRFTVILGGSKLGRFGLGQLGRYLVQYINQGCHGVNIRAYFFDLGTGPVDSRHTGPVYHRPSSLITGIDIHNIKNH